MSNLRLIVLLLVPIAIPAASLRGQDAAPKPPIESIRELESQQKQLAIRFGKLEELFIRMSELEAAANPTRASLLMQAAQMSKQLATLQRLNSASDLLSQKQFTRAIQEQEASRENLKKLLELLQSENRTTRLRDERARIEDIQKEIRRLEQIQRGQTARTEAGQDFKQASTDQKDIKDQLEKVDADLKASEKKDSSENSESSDKQNPSDKEAADKDAADKEAANKEAVSKEDRVDIPKPNDQSDPSQKPDPTQKSDQSPKSDQSQKSGQPSKSDTQEKNQPNPSDKPNPNEGEQPKDKQPKSDKEKGEQAKSEQSKSEQSKSEQSKGEQSKSEQSKSEQSKSESSEKGENSKSQPQSREEKAKERVQSAKKRMQKAKESLDEQKRDDAVAEQREAEKELREAIEELERILRQLREEEIERSLVDVETRLRKMLDLQKSVREETARLSSLTGDARDRTLEIQSNKLSVEQSKVVMEGQRALLLLQDEGSSTAFPEALEQVNADAQAVAKRLTQANVSTSTQAIEDEIIGALEEMLESLKQVQKKRDDKKQQRQKQQQQQSGSEEEEPLVDSISELKLLKTLQLRVNRRTQALSKQANTQEDAVGQIADPSLLGELTDLAERQQKIHEVTRDILVKAVKE